MVDSTLSLVLHVASTLFYFQESIELKLDTLDINIGEVKQFVPIS